MNAKDWFSKQGRGLFTHYLYHAQNLPGSAVSAGAAQSDWNACVDEFDAKRFAEQVHQTGSNYLMFTLMQGKRFMCAPNATFDRLTGYQPGAACSRRDLIADLLDALAPYGISLFLYYTGDGPYQDPIAGPALGFTEPREDVSTGFIDKWAEVAREYSLRYGSAIKGWWVDGCYTYFGYDDAKLARYVPALRAGNPESLLAFNGGVKPRVSYYSAHDDYTCGEMNSFVDVPDARFVDGAQWHILAPLGISPDGTEWGAWCQPGCKHTQAYMRDYLRRVHAVGGVATVDVALYRDGHIDPEQLELLSGLGD